MRQVCLLSPNRNTTTCNPWYSTSVWISGSLLSPDFANYHFTTGGTAFELSANAQIWPRALNSQIGGEEGKIYLVVADLGSPSGQGLDFISASFILSHDSDFSLFRNTKTVSSFCKGFTAFTIRRTLRSGLLPHLSLMRRPTEDLLEPGRIACRRYRLVHHTVPCTIWIYSLIPCKACVSQPLCLFEPIECQ